MATLYAALGGPSTTSALYSVDPLTGAMTSIGATGFALTGLAFDPTTGTLYGATSPNSTSNPRSIITIDPASGAGTLVGAEGGSDTPLTDICFVSSGQMYGWAQHAKLAVVDKATGASATPFAGNTGTTSYGGISATSANVLYAEVNGNLYTVNSSTGVWTLVGASDAINALAFDETDVLYGVLQTGAHTRKLITIDTATGTVTQIGDMTNDADALAWGVTVAVATVRGVSIAFDDETLEPAPLWTRLDDPVGYRLATRWSISRGRQSELDKTGTGTATIELVDKDGTLDPTNPSSPFAGLLDPMKQAAIALRNPVANTWHTVFRGFISDWFYDLDVSGNFATVRLELADAFDLLAALEMTPGHHGDTAPSNSEGDIYFSQTVGPTPGPFQRITKILDDAGWPADLRFVLTGNVQLQGTVYARRDQALSALFDTADAEFPGVGNVYVDKIGQVSFRGRYSRFDPDNPDWQISFFNAGGRPQADADPENVAPIMGVSFRRSKGDIINAGLCLPQGVDDSDVPGSLVKDDASITTFGWRSVSFDNLLTYSGRESPDATTFPINAVNETKLYAKYYVDNYAQPTTRVDKISFRSRGVENAWAGALWSILCTIDIGDVIHLETTHPGGGGFDEDYFVEGLTYDCSPKSEEDDGDGFPDVTLELDVSPRSLYGLSPFLLGADDTGGGSDFSVSIEGTPEEGETLTAV